jgi:dTDP-4-amino-4,6-dideoxygalactose transaminase
MTLLFDALMQEGRKTLIMPAFLCPSVARMGAATGMRPLLIDVAPDSLHMDLGLLERCLGDYSDAETVVLVDNSFGNPVPWLPDLRRRHPGLLIIEDCVRALGSTIGGVEVGHTGDWVLFSLYKSVPGGNHGAVLLTRSPYRIRCGPPPQVTWRQLAAGSHPARFLYRLLVARRHPEFDDTQRPAKATPWEPTIGVPNQLSLTMFANELAVLQERMAERRLAENEIRATLGTYAGIRVLQPVMGCASNASYLSFVFENDGMRNHVLMMLHRRGVFLQRLWDAVPAFFDRFRECFPFGADGSEFLADHVAHIPLGLFVTSRSRRRLYRSLQDALGTWDGEGKRDVGES